MPKAWIELRKPNTHPTRLFYEQHEIENDIPVVLRSIAVNISSMSITKYIIGGKVDTKISENPEKFESLFDVSNILENFSQLELCAGIKDPKFLGIKFMKTGSFQNGKWNSHG